MEQSNLALDAEPAEQQKGAALTQSVLRLAIEQFLRYLGASDILASESVDPGVRQVIQHL